MYFSFKFDESNVPMHSCGSYPISLLDKFSQRLCVHEEYNIIILLVFAVNLVFPYFMVSFPQAGYWDIHVYIVQGVSPDSEGNQN